jgi:hypothetical protein
MEVTFDVLRTEAPEPKRNEFRISPHYTSVGISAQYIDPFQMIIRRNGGFEQVFEIRISHR